jgi:UDP-glucuronate decarboxylase
MLHRGDRPIACNGYVLLACTVCGVMLTLWMLERPFLPTIQHSIPTTCNAIVHNNYPSSEKSNIPPFLLPMERGGNSKRILITGGAGFIGSHLTDRLIEQGHTVIVLDNMFTGSRENIKHHLDNPHFKLIEWDVEDPIYMDVDQIYHLACPASPQHYQYDPIKTMKTNVIGTMNMLGLAKRTGARFLLASTSEIYGDPEVHPQNEQYRGSVNTTGVRSCYDEGKRAAETLSFDYHREHGVEIRVARIFNTYGPRMNINDGRVVSNFITQALQGKAITVYGGGTQTRSFCYVSDLVAGLMALMNGDHTGPFNLGNPYEMQVIELAEKIKGIIDKTDNVEIIHKPLPSDDPRRRQPDISKAKKLLGWEPVVGLDEGLEKAIEYFSSALQQLKSQSKDSKQNVVGDNNNNNKSTKKKKKT